MLCGPSHHDPSAIAHAMVVCDLDRDVPRGLAAQFAEAAASPVHAEKARMWQRLNDEDVDITKTDDEIVSRELHIQIHDFADLE